MKLRVRQTAASIVVALNLVALVGYVAPASAAAADCTQNVSASNVTVSGTSGIDVICVTGTNNVVNAGAGNDTIIVSGSNNTINGGDGNDSIDASNASGPTVENGGPGNDTLTGSPSSDTLDGGTDDDTLIGGAADDTMNGGEGNDNLQGSAGDDNISGEAGEDTIDGGDGTDTLDGGTDDDTLIGGAANDTMNGGEGNDNLQGSAGADNIYGEAGTDSLIGNEGNDILAGGDGVDSIDGGSGLNICDFTTGEVITQSCTYDDSAPVASSMTMSTSTVEVGTSSATFTIHFTLTDATAVDHFGLGCSYNNVGDQTRVDVTVDSSGVASGTNWVSDLTSTRQQVSGTASFLIPLGTAPGIRACWLYAYDTLRNFTEVGRLAEITINRTGGSWDDSAPVASSMTMSTSTVEVGTSSATFTIHFTLTDATAVDHFGLGCSYNNVGDQTRVDVTVDSSGVASGTNWVSDLTSTRQQVSGTASFLIPLGTAPGIRACWLYAYDTLRNFTEVGRLAEITINRTPAGLPSSPLSLLGSQSLPTTATLSWSAPDSLGSPVLNDYVVQYSTDGSTWITINDGISSTPSLPISNLIVDTDYWFRVRGENGGTVGQDTTYMSLSWSNILQIRTPSATVPEPPTALLITAVMSTSATLSWTAPVYNGGSAITDFKVETSRYGVTWTVVPHTASTSVSLSLSGLAPGTTYQVRVSAVNAIGASSYETNTVTTLTTSASAPRSVTASAVTTSTLTLKWLIPSSNGGAAITDYKVEVSGNAGTTWTSISHTPSNSLSFNVTRLTRAKTYKFRISAITSYGQGSTSSVLTVSTSADVPAAPSSLTVSNVTSSTAALTWQLPANNGGSAITDYKVESSRNGVTWTVVPHTASRRLGLTLSGLAPGTTYQVRVSAVNAIGASRSYTTNTLTTLTTSASAPRSVTASAVTTSTLKLTWLIPSSNGGAAITDYKVEVSGNAGTTWTSITHVASNSLAFNVTRLTRAKTYKFRISAITSFGQGATSSVLTVLTLP